MVRWGFRCSVGLLFELLVGIGVFGAVVGEGGGFVIQGAQAATLVQYQKVCSESKYGDAHIS